MLTALNTTQVPTVAMEALGLTHQVTLGQVIFSLKLLLLQLFLLARTCVIGICLKL